MKILLVSFHFYPDAAIGARRISELAAYLHARGHEVVAVCGTGAPIQAEPALTERVHGIRVERIAVPGKLTPRLLAWLPRRRAAAPQASAAAANDEGGPATESRLARLKRYYHSFEWLVDDRKLWSLLAALHLARLALRERFDLVISSGPPMSPHLAVLAARRLLRCRWIMDLRDPWTDDQDWLRHVRSPLSDRINAFLERRCVLGADAVTTTTPSLARLLRRRYPSQEEAIHTIYNGYDGAPQETPAPVGALRLLYAGSIYYNRDPFPLLEAFAALLNQPEVDRRKVSLRLVGNCQAWRGRSLAQWIDERGLGDRIELRPPVPPGEVARLLAEANVLVNFAQGQPHQIPAKMFEYIAAGREMLLIAERDSDSAALLRAAGGGRVCDPREPLTLLPTLSALYRHYVIEARGFDADPTRLARFARSGQNRRFLELVTTAPLTVSETAT